MKTLVNRILELAKEQPNNVAVLDNRGGYTYNELNRRSAHLAKRILEKLGTGEKRSKRIALLLSRTRDYMVAMLAVLRAGCAAVPVDNEYPAKRVQAILSDVGCGLCLTVKSREKDLRDTPYLLTDELFSDDASVIKAGTLLDLSDLEAEGLILYTSGSTGKPKGVIHSQRMLNAILERNEDVFSLSTKTRMLCAAAQRGIRGCCKPCTSGQGTGQGVFLAPDSAL